MIMSQKCVYDIHVAAVRDQLNEIGFICSNSNKDIYCKKFSFAIIPSIIADSDTFNIFLNVSIRDYDQIRIVRKTLKEIHNYAFFGVMLAVPPHLVGITVSERELSGTSSSCIYDFVEEFMYADDWQYLFLLLERDKENTYPRISWEPDISNDLIWNLEYSQYRDPSHYIRLRGKS